jgi:hypothetical protein
VVLLTTRGFGSASRIRATSNNNQKVTSKHTLTDMPSYTQGRMALCYGTVQGTIPKKSLSKIAT